MFESDTLAEGWAESFSNLEVVGLPRDPYTGSYPIDFPHSMEFIQIQSGAGGEDVYRLVIASLGSFQSENDTDGTAEVYMYDITTSSTGEASRAELFCGTSMPTSTNSHFDFVLPGDAGDRGLSWVGAYTSNPHGELHWLDLNQTDSNQRCRYTGAQVMEQSSENRVFAMPIWSSEIDATRLYGAEVSSVEIDYNADVLAPSMVPQSP